MPTQRTHAESCAILEIAASATPEEIRRGYQRLAMLWHPDRFEPDSPLWVEAQQKIQDINEAYRHLQDHPRPVRPPAPPLKPARKPSAGNPWFPVVGLLAVAGMAWGLVGSFKEVLKPGPEVESPQTPAPAPPSGGAGEPRPAPLEARPHPSTLWVDQPALVIFWPSKKELDESASSRATEIAQFLESAHEVQGKVQKARPDLKIMLTDAEFIHIQGVVIRRSQTCGYGYLVFAPPKSHVLIQGLQEIDKMVGCICENFPPQDGTASKDPVL